MRRERSRRLGRPPLQDAPSRGLPTPDRILEAASELFSERGYASASMTAIAERADLTSGAIYAHFESKRELLLAVVRRALQKSPLAELARPDAVSSRRPLPELVSMYVDPSRRRLRRLAVEVHEAAVRDKGVADLLADANRQVKAAFRSRIQAAILADATEPPQPDYAASLLLVLAMGLAHLDTLDPDLIGDSDFETWLEQAVLRMLGAATPGDGS